MNGIVLFLIGEKVGVPGSTTMILCHPRASSASEARLVVVVEVRDASVGSKN